MTRTIPGPQPKPIIGTLHSIDTEHPLQSNWKLAQQYGELFAQQFPGNRRVLFASSRRLVDELCDETRFDKRVHASLDNIRSFAGDGLFTARTEEPNWHKAHQILMPAFSPMALRTMFDGMDDVARQLVLKWERLGPAEDVDVVSDFTRLTLDTIALCSFSYRFNSFYSQQMHPFVDAMVRSLLESGARGRRLPAQTKLMVHRQHQYDEDRELMFGIVDQLIAERQAHPLPDGQHDILDTMLSAQDPTTGERLSLENVRYQLVTFLIAGHETTSGLLSFTLYELLRNPEVLRTAREHVDQVLGGRAPRYEDLARLGYLDQVLRETLRLWPTAPAFALRPYESTTIGDSEPGAGDGYPAGPEDTVMVIIPALHRDPEVWEQPERFDPDRFGFERAQQIPSNAWKPFGNGQRSCIGRGFALQEAQLVLAMVLQRFDMTLADPGYEVRVKETLTLKPEGLRVRFTPRPGRRAAEIGMAEQPVGEAGPGTEALPEVPSHGTPLTVLFGSNAGTSEAFAQRIVTRGRQLGYATSLAPLDDGVDALPGQGAVVVVTSSYEGLPPDNAKRFVDWVQHLEPGSLAGRHHAVLGCGNTDWARTYQRIPTLVDDALTAAGSSPVLQRGETNARGDFFGAFDEWHEQLWPALAEALGVQGLPEAEGRQDLAVEVLGSAREPLLDESGLGLGHVVDNRELVDMSHPGARSRRHVEVELPQGASYSVGDYLVLLPTNPPRAGGPGPGPLRPVPFQRAAPGRAGDLPAHRPAGGGGGGLLVVGGAATARRQAPGGAVGGSLPVPAGAGAAARARPARGAPARGAGTSRLGAGPPGALRVDRARRGWLPVHADPPGAAPVLDQLLAAVARGPCHHLGGGRRRPRVVRPGPLPGRRIELRVTGRPRHPGRGDGTSRPRGLHPAPGPGSADRHGRRRHRHRPLPGLPAGARDPRRAGGRDAGPGGALPGVRLARRRRALRRRAGRLAGAWPGGGAPRLLPGSRTG